jgi:hypothetical protein
MEQSFKSWLKPNLVGSISNGFYQFCFNHNGLEVWPILESEITPTNTHWFEVLGFDLGIRYFGVYGTSEADITITPWIPK